MTVTHAYFTSSNETIALSKLSTQGLPVVFVPTEEITLLTLNIPPLKTRDTQQALLYAAEPFLAQAIETMDLTVLKKDKKNKSSTCAVYTKAWAKKYTAALKEKKCFPARVLPDIFALPYEDNRQTAPSAKPVIPWSLFMDTHGLLARTGSHEGFFADTENMALYLEKAWDDLRQRFPEATLQCRLFIADASTADRLKMSFFTSHQNFISKISEETCTDLASVFRASLEKKTSFVSIRDSFASLLKPSGNDRLLLSRIFFSRLSTKIIKTGRALSPQQLASVGVCGLLLFLLSMTAFKYDYLKKKMAFLEENTRSLYAPFYPHAHTITEAQIQIKQDLMQRQRAYASPFWSTLARIARIFEASKACRLEKLACTKKILTLKVQARDALSLENVKKNLERAGFPILSLHTVPRYHEASGSVSATLQLRLTLK